MTGPARKLICGWLPIIGGTKIDGGDSFEQASSTGGSYGVLEGSLHRNGSRLARGN